MLRIGGQQAVIPRPLSALWVTGGCHQPRDRAVASADLLSQKGLIAAPNTLVYCRGKKRAAYTSGMGRCLSKCSECCQKTQNKGEHFAHQSAAARSKDRVLWCQENPGKSCPGTAWESIASSIYKKLCFSCLITTKTQRLSLFLPSNSAEADAVVTKSSWKSPWCTTGARSKIIIEWLVLEKPSKIT